MIRSPGIKPRTRTAADPVPMAFLGIEYVSNTSKQALRSRAAVRAAHRTVRALEDAPGVRSARVVSAFVSRR